VACEAVVVVFVGSVLDGRGAGFALGLVVVVWIVKTRSVWSHVVSS
jgi:hypothetical protein